MYTGHTDTRAPASHTKVHTDRPDSLAAQSTHSMLSNTNNPSFRNSTKSKIAPCISLQA